MWNGTTDQVKQSEEIACVILRHGKTDYNELGKYLGQCDLPLSPKGEEELWKKKATLCLPPAEVCVCSPLLRCRQTAKRLWPDAELFVVEDFREIDFGRWEGKTYRELSSREDTKEEYQAWIDSGGENAFPDGESRAEFIRRVQNGWDFFVRELQYGKTFEGVSRIGYVVHGGTIMALLSWLFGGDYYDYRVENADGYRFTLNRQSGKVSGLTGLDGGAL